MWGNRSVESTPEHYDDWLFKLGLRFDKNGETILETFYWKLKVAIGGNRSQSSWKVYKATMALISSFVRTVVQVVLRSTKWTSLYAWRLLGLSIPHQSPTENLPQFCLVRMTLGTQVVRCIVARLVWSTLMDITILLCGDTTLVIGEWSSYNPF